MIHLDTNFLVELATMGSDGGRRLREWLKSGRQVGTSAIAWSEFCNGPLSHEQKEAAFAVLDENIADFTWRDGEEAARLFNLGGRRRGSHADCMIAASAIATGATLATRNHGDFERFVPYGLKLEVLE
ncbi:type II toxin-antitoxin system VapC family toxin [Luteolibacter flavescens]|uniref:Ribonuclease VapC n=1 Tax=Luteolibacter flavescens TaxID=1859460 RepID=A0ABT3FPV2_9BACT|nr:type II toxin-antitoxin system VapC family toxin [Luteolibacter flavescens]MCW1885261.1 type II toxin-antitoxin system VapC family toxin [Luteolibacter flavescens]